MGLFNFHVHSKEELALIETHIFLCLSLGLDEKTANKMAKQAMSMTIDDAKKTGEYYLPNNLYDVVFNGATPSDIASKLYFRGVDLHKLKSEMSEVIQKSMDKGISNEEIENWANRSAVSRGMQIEWENFKFIFALTKLKLSQPNLSENEASRMIAKQIPTYATFNKYTFDIKNHETDGILSPELINRVNNYIEIRLKYDSINFEEEMNLSSSMNALIRKEISIGKLI